MRGLGFGDSWFDSGELLLSIALTPLHNEISSIEQPR